MKKNCLTVLLTAIAALITACTDDNAPVGMQSDRDDGVVRIVAGHFSDDTKSVLGEGGSVLWSPYDSIKVFYGESSQGDKCGKCVSDNAQSAETAVFSGSIPYKEYSLNSEGYYYAFYPYTDDCRSQSGMIFYDFPIAQQAVENSFAPGTFPSVARSTDLRMHFYNVCGGIKFSVTASGVNRVTFKSNSEEQISGSGGVWFDEQGKPCANIWGGGVQVVVIAPEGGFVPGCSYYVVLPPVRFSKGFTVTFMTNNQIAERVIEREVEIRRSVFSRLTDADRGLCYVDLPSQTELLSGPDGVKYWFWDTYAEWDGTVWGLGWNDGDGYEAENGTVPGKLWGYTPEELLENPDQAENYSPHGDESSFAYMTLDSDGNCVSYTEDGVEIRRGVFSINGYDPSHRSDGWSLGKFTTDKPAIMWPYIMNTGGQESTEFDILNLSEDALTLSRNHSGVLTGSGGNCTWWRFRGVTKSVFDNGKPEKFALDSNKVDTYTGLEFELVPHFFPAGTEFWGVSWTIDDQNVVSRNSNGRFRAGRVGETVITAATAGGLSVKCPVSVRERIYVDNFYLDVNHFEIVEGDSRQIYATILPENASLKEIVWSVADTSIATVSSDGVVTAVSKGWTYVSALTDGGRYRASCSLYVQDRHVWGIELDPWGKEVYPGDQYAITAKVLPEYAENKKVIWSAANETIAMVNDTGLVTAIAPGWTQIIATTDEVGYQACHSVYVMERNVTGVTLDRTSAEIFVGDKILLTATLTPENATNQAVSWYSDKNTVATVDKNGTVRGVGSGTANITVKTQDGSFTATCKVMVRSNGVEPGIGDWGDGDNHSGETY